jgi:hypothetical protein
VELIWWEQNYWRSCRLRSVIRNTYLVFFPVSWHRAPKIPWNFLDGVRGVSFAICNKMRWLLGEGVAGGISHVIEGWDFQPPSPISASPEAGEELCYLLADLTKAMEPPEILSYGVGRASSLVTAFICQECVLPYLHIAEARETSGPHAMCHITRLFFCILQNLQT